MRTTVQLSQDRAVTFDDELLAGCTNGDNACTPLLPLRTTYAASRVVLRADYAGVQHSQSSPGSPDEVLSAIDWESTCTLRLRLDALGFGIAEAMDTAQRFRLGWPAAERLLRETSGLRLKQPFIAGAGLDHISHCPGLDAVADAVLKQMELIQGLGGLPIILPLLPLAGAPAQDYVRIYGRIIRSHDGPLLLHWLGEMFMPSLRGYFPGQSLEDVLAVDPHKVLGVKLSLLDPQKEISLRRKLRASGQFIFTGDDYHFSDLLFGGTASLPTQPMADVEGWRNSGGLQLAVGDFSHALLGVFDAIALPARHALTALARGDPASYWRLMHPCTALGRALFEPPTEYYKAGLAFIAWLEGLQDNFFLVNHEETGRSLEHYVRIAQLASAAGVFTNAGRTAERFQAFLRSASAS